MSAFNLSELNRKLENLILIGTIAEVDHANKTVVVEVGDDDEELTTKPLPWPCEVGNNFIAWRPLRVGTQVVLVCMSGDIANAVIVGMLYTTAITPDEHPEYLDTVIFEDGTEIEYNSQNSSLTIHSVGDVNVIADGDIAMMSANMTIETGNLSITADNTTIRSPIEQTGGDITSDGISVQHHKHTEMGDGALVGEPE